MGCIWWYEGCQLTTYISVSHGRQRHLLKCCLYPQSVLIPKLYCKSALAVSSEHMKYWACISGIWESSKCPCVSFPLPCFGTSTTHISLFNWFFSFLLFQVLKKNPASNFVLAVVHITVVLWETLLVLPSTKSVMNVGLVLKKEIVTFVRKTVLAIFKGCN